MNGIFKNGYNIGIISLYIILQNLEKNATSWPTELESTAPLCNITVA